MILIDLTYYCNKEVKDADELLQKQKESLGYIDFIKEQVDIRIIKHTRFSKKEIINGTPYLFFRGSNNFFHVPLSAIRFIRKERPDIIIVQGLIFPVQTLLLRLMIGNRSKILVQHHGELPFGFLKKLFQKIADRCVNGYLFTAKGNARPWLELKIIRNATRCYEVQEASTSFLAKDKRESRELLRLQRGLLLLWVGRLDDNKDPLTVIKGFERFLNIQPDAHLYMVYQTEELLPGIKELLQKNDALKRAVHLVGKIPHDELPSWYSAADIFISGSHRESCGFALLEAMACGCIPLVTQIPSFQKITNNGQFGFLFETGNDDDLIKKLILLNSTNQKSFSNAVATHFYEALSHKAIAETMYTLCGHLIKK